MSDADREALAKLIHDAERNAWPEVSADPQGGCLGMDRCRFVADRLLDAANRDAVLRAMGKDTSLNCDECMADYGRGFEDGKASMKARAEAAEAEQQRLSMALSYEREGNRYCHECDDHDNPRKCPNQERADAAETERDMLAQALFDGYAALGFDTDDCKQPGAFIAGAGSYRAFAESMLRAFREARQDYDDLLDESDAAERKVARVEMLRDSWRELGTNSTVYESGGELAEILTAALADEETDR